MAWLCYRLYRLRVSDRMHRREVDTQVHMHAAQLGMAKTIAETGVAAVLRPTAAVVIPPGSPLTVDELLRAAGGREPGTSPEGSPVAELPGPAPPVESARG